MMAPDSFRFLDSWTRLLPRRGGAVIALAGSGGCTTLLLRILEILGAVEEGTAAHPPRVLVTQTTAHPVPLQHLDAHVEFEALVGGPQPARSRGALTWVTGPLLDATSDRRAGLNSAQFESVVRACAPEVVVVQAQASSGTPLRRDASEPIWPANTGLAIAVAPLSVVGRTWDERSVAGAVAECDPNGDPRRVTTTDVLDDLRAVLSTVPLTARPMPFLTGFGSFRDLDGMFALVQALWEDPRVPVVCLGELLGDERRDAADLAALDASTRAGALSGDRVYAVYPAELDGPDT